MRIIFTADGLPLKWVIQSDKRRQFYHLTSAFMMFVTRPRDGTVEIRANNSRIAPNSHLARWLTMAATGFIILGER